MVRLKIALVAVLIASPAAAQQCGTLTTCPQVSTPLAGSELLYVVQGGVSKKMTASTLGGAISPFIALVPGMTISPSTNGGLLWDNNGVLADSLAPLQTALPSLTTSQLYGGTGGAGVAQHFPAGAGVETALQQALNGTGAPVGSISPRVTTPTFLSSDNLVNTSAPAGYQQFATTIRNSGEIDFNSLTSTGSNNVEFAFFQPWVTQYQFPGFLTLVSPVAIYEAIGGLPMIGRFNTFPMPNPTSAPTITHSGGGGAGSATYYYRCLDANSGYSLASPGASDSGGWPTGSLSPTQYNTVSYTCPAGYSNAALFRNNVLTGWIETNINGSGVISALPGVCGNSPCTFNDGANYPAYSMYNGGNGPFPSGNWSATAGSFYASPDANTSAQALFGDLLYAQRGISISGGADIVGRIAIAPEFNPSAPTVTPNTTGTTSYSYYTVLHDYAGGVSTVSPVATITNGNATPNNTITCVAPGIYYFSCDILKGTTSLSLATNIASGASVIDTGQSTSAYVPPTRNTTSDLNIWSEITAAGDIILQPLAPGYAVRVQNSTGWNGAVFQDNLITFNNPLAMGGNAITGAAGITATAVTILPASGNSNLTLENGGDLQMWGVVAGSGALGAWSLYDYQKGVSPLVVNAGGINDNLVLTTTGGQFGGTLGVTGTFTASTNITDTGLATQGVTCNSAAGLLSTTRGRCANAVPATGVKVAASPTFPSSTSAYLMQGLGGAITPGSTGNVLITISGTINAASATTVDNGVRYQISYGTGTAPTSNSVLAGTQIGGIQTYTSAIAPTAVGDVNVPFSTTYLVTGLTLGTTYWIDLAAESVTTVSDMGFTQVAVTAVEQ